MGGLTAEEGAALNAALITITTLHDDGYKLVVDTLSDSDLALWVRPVGRL